MPGWKCGEGRVDGRGVRTATDERGPGTWRRGETFHGMRLGARWPHTLNNPSVRCPKEVALAGLAANRADFFPKISENPNLSVFAGMAQGGRYWVPEAARDGLYLGTDTTSKNSVCQKCRGTHLSGLTAQIVQLLISSFKFRAILGPRRLSITLADLIGSECL